MKTTNQTTKRFPDGFRMILYIAAVAALGFLSCNVNAADFSKTDDFAARLEVASAPEAEHEIKLEDWMLDPAYFDVPDYLIVEQEEEPVLEDWMLDPGYYVAISLFIAENDR